MPNSENPNGTTVIVGAGLAGLTLGYLLSQAGKPVVLVEQEPVVGGLARSYHYDGFTFDIGPHRFHTDDQDVLAFIRDVLGEDHLVIRRKSGVYMFGKYFDWPLSSSSIFKMPPGIMMKSVFDLLSRYEPENPDSFTEYTISRYGKTLYEHFFKYYTEKFIQIPCEDVHVDWATAGINRAVIDKRVKANTLFDIIKGVLLPKKVDTDFIYPNAPGCADFSERLADKIRSKGGRILTGTQVTNISNSNGIVSEVTLSNGESIEVENLAWSGEIHSLARMLEMGPYSLRYLAMVCYNIAVSGELNRDYQWLYYGDRSITINRISAPKLFNTKNTPDGYCGVNVEITCFEDDDTWQNPEQWIPTVKKDLVTSKLVSRDDQMEEVWIERVKNTYPIYDLDYKVNLKKATEELSSVKNLLLLGRCGTFWYNNMDHSMKMAMDYADHLITGKEIAGKDTYFAH
jgi:protoporphyrinogen oxidase